jgi:transcriptional regulator with XRE-family HTH domain
MELRGDIVKSLRLSKQWTQQQLSEVCDVNLRTIQRVENQGSASLETIMALCVAFEVKREVLFAVPKPEENTLQTVPNPRRYFVIFLGGVVVGALATVVLSVILNP